MPTSAAVTLHRSSSPKRISLFGDIRELVALRIAGHRRKLSDVTALRVSDPYNDGFRSLPADSREATYWQARHKLTAAARVLNEKLVSSDITPELAAELTLQIEQITTRLSATRQIEGLVDMSKQPNRGSVDNIMGELVAIAGRSHPCTPALSWIEEGNRIHGTVTFGQAFEGPPGHTHGGWVAGILDHLMGMTHVRRAPGHDRRGFLFAT